MAPMHPCSGLWSLREYLNPWDSRNGIYSSVGIPGSLRLSPITWIVSLNIVLQVVCGTINISIRFMALLPDRISTVSATIIYDNTAPGVCRRAISSLVVKPGRNIFTNFANAALDMRNADRDSWFRYHRVISSIAIRGSILVGTWILMDASEWIIIKLITSTSSRQSSSEVEDSSTSISPHIDRKEVPSNQITSRIWM